MIPVSKYRRFSTNTEKHLVKLYILFELSTECGIGFEMQGGL